MTATTRDAETRAVCERFEDVETLESVARTLPRAQATRLNKVALNILRAVAPVRASAAAKLLSISERTVRAWTAEGILAQARNTGSTRLLLDPEQLHEVLHIVRELREHGHDRRLMDAVYQRLTDQALLDRPDLQQSLEQMRGGEVSEA